MTHQASRADVASQVRSVIMGLRPDLRPEQIAEDETLAGLGIDSVDRIEILLTIAAQYRLEDRVSRLGAHSNVGALIDYLKTVTTHR